MKCFFTILVFAFSLSSNAQNIKNLVENGDFEILNNNTCVKTANASVREFLGWFDIGVRIERFDGVLSRTSADSYHVDTCGFDVAWNNSVPFNFGGYQYPLSGKGYVGFLFQNAREFVSGTLKQPTRVGHIYCIKINVNLAEVSRSSFKDLQIVFHTDSTVFVVPFSPIPGQMTNNYQGQLDKIDPITFVSDFISDTVSWLSLEASFVADSAYNFFTIGNFGHTLNTEFKPLRASDSSSSPFTYIFLDDVLIFDCSDTIPPPEPVFVFEVKAYPNPASEWFNFEYTLPEAGKVRLHITDVFGKMVLARTELTGQKGINTLPIDVNAWAMGQYHVSVLYEAHGQSAYRHLKMQVVR